VLFPFEAIDVLEIETRVIGMFVVVFVTKGEVYVWVSVGVGKSGLCAMGSIGGGRRSGSGWSGGSDSWL